METRSGVKGVRELLRLSCSMNYDSKRYPSNSVLLHGIVARLLPHYEFYNY
jgi:hypothetical protein